MNKNNPASVNSSGCSISEKKKYIAIASAQGLFVNLNLEECEILRIYSIVDCKPELIDLRKIPGNEFQPDIRYQQLVTILSDCACLLVYGIDPYPQKVLQQAGLSVYILEGFVDKILLRLSQGKSIDVFNKDFTIDLSETINKTNLYNIYFKEQLN